MRSFALLLCLCTASAQTPNRALGGRVFDPARAVIQDAAVTISNQFSGESKSTRSNADGRYGFTSVAPSLYTMTVESPGFTRYVERDIDLHGQTTVVHDVVLGLLPVEQQVTVSDKAPAMETGGESAHQHLRETLEAREVVESGARDPAEALASIDGLAKIRKGGIANDIIIRGLAHDNINVLVNGARLHGACPNGMDPRTFHVDFAEIERIEVTKGAFDIRNQGSLSGSVNIVTKDPEQGLRISPSLSAGSYGFYNPSLVGSYSGETAWILAGYSFRISQAYRDGSGRQFTEYTNYLPGVGSSEAFHIGTGWFRAGVATGSTGRAELTYTRQDGDQALYPYLMMDAVYDNADRLGLAWSAPRAGFLSDVRIDTYASRVKHWMTDERRSTSAGTPFGFSMASFAESLVVGGKAQARVHGVLAGVESYRRKWDGVNTRRAMGAYVDQHMIPSPVTDVVGGYGEYHRTFGTRLRLTAGGRLDRASAEVRASDANVNLLYAYHGSRRLSAVDLNPSANVWLGYAVGPVELFVGAGHTARVPDPVERYMAFERMGSDWVGNPMLRATRNSEADLGFAWRNSRISIRPTVFYSSLANYITIENKRREAPAPMVANSIARSFANVNAAIYGGELAYSIAFSRALLFSGGVSSTHAVKDVRPEAGITSRAIAEVPPLRAHGTLRYGNRKFFAEVGFTAVDAQRRVDRDLLEMPTPGYGVVDAKTGVHTAKLNLALGLANLFDRYYYEHCSYQRDPFRSGVRVAEPGRNFFIAMQYRF